ncbi:META domain-containing protein [Rhodobacteraceae bacterium LMO-12]|nr:META domain-containing protein [Rhodobacteraceae bacterium LMO-JJ12]
MKRALFAGLLAASPLHAHDNHAPFDAPGHVWQLIEMNNTPFTARVTLTFPEPGKLAGEAPCNRYFGAMWGDYPWFKAGRIAATRRACPDLSLEHTYLQLLESMTHAEAGSDHLILTDGSNQSLVFRLIQAPD